ncbi:Cytoplasmic dynein 2 heavy chain 1 [Diplonema papillatum]|nr:Cytoplasmic dynein 2 heavy chain 1 [Diplonema papillatum]
MLQALSRAADNLLRSREINAVKSDNSTDEVFEYEWNKPNASADSCVQLVERLVGGLVKDLKSSDSHKVLHAQEDATGVELDFASGYRQETFQSFMEKAMHEKFSSEHVTFPNDQNTKLVLQKLLDAYVDQFNSPTFIVDFPGILSGDGEKEGKRIDLIILKKRVVSVLIVDATVTLKLRAADLARILVNLTDMSEVEQLLPNEWPGLEEIADALEIIQDKVNDWYRGRGLSERKAAYVLSTIGTRLAEYLKSRLDTETELKEPMVWKGPYVTVKQMLELAIGACEKWMHVTRTLTSVDWHEWQGGPHVDPTILALSKRLEEILRLRSTFDQLAQLLTKQELTEMKKKIDAAFDVFTNLQPFDLEVTDAATWSRAVKQFEQRLEPVEQRSAGRLRQELGKVSTNAQALLQGFIRFNDIVKRPMIGAELTSERDNLLAKLSERVNGLKSEFEAKYRKDDLGASELDDRRLQAGRNMPVVVNSLIWARQLRQKIEHVHSSGSSLLSDLTRFEQFSLMCNGLLTELKDYESETFGTWISEIQESIGHVTRDSSSLTLRMEGKIMEISKRDGRLIVNFSERLVELVREVRQLIALGYAVPAAIQKVAQDALRFYRNATVLKQVANFYNTLSGNLIPCTITLLEKPITHFENVVKGKGSKSQISWGDKSEADQYTMKLKDAAEILTKENRKLRRVHDDFIVLVKQLMDIDLVKNIDKWKVVLKEMRSKFTDLERNGYKATGPWKRHWDHQLYKALEYQYLQGLETLNESLPDMPINLCFKQGQIVFDPVFEKVREHYYKNIRDFIAIPVSFKGVGDAEVFKAMAERNEAGIETVFLKTEGLFSRLGKVKRKYKEYVMLGLVDLEQWVELLSEVSDWEKNFKMIKAKGKEIGALEDSIRIDCFIISTIPIKAAIDDQLSRLGQLLNHSLKKSAEKHLLGIETFLTEGIAKLNESPTTLEDIGRANKAYQEMKDQQEPMQRLMKQFDEKSNLYKKVSGATLDGTAVRSKLGAFDDLLKAHEQMMEEQIARLRNEVSRDIEKYFAELDGFCVLWKEQKPKDMSALKDHAAISAALQFIKDRQAELDDLAQRGKSVIDQCQYFKLEEPDMGKLKDVKEDVQSLTSVWALYEGFVGEVDEFKEENWFAFRSKAFKFEDFVRDWKEKLKEKPTNDVVIYIRSKLDSWTNMLPLLKFCRGDGMTMDHWTEMFRFLDVDRHEVKPEKLTFGHFIDRSDVICSREKDLKGLHARAQGEIQIREALAEVRAWAHEAEFNLVKGGKSSLIKDWKELLTQVSDNQSLLGSLKDSPYYQGFSGEASSWEQKFVALDEYLHLLMQIQRKWVYLEPIFARGALPAEQPRFRRVDKTFQEIMRDIDADARVIELSKRDLGSSLKSILEQLDRCQKALNEYLEQKRDRFPRFYFIGDDDLLEILGQSQNPVVIQNHLKKLFSGISRVEFDDSKQKIRSIVSSDGEIVPLVNEVTVSAEVESWLSLLDQEMRNTLVDMLWGCVKENDLFKFPSQLLCLSELIHWTQKAHLAIKQRRLPELRESLNERLRAYTRSKNEAEGIVSVLKMKALIMDLIHSIDVIDQLIACNVKTELDWAWQKQLRFYLKEEATPCKVHMVNASFVYTFEYQGNAPKLVHTPLTDKCYLTLTQGMHLGYGGNPYGPAGTGKTESVKALGNALGRQVLVFNCDEGIDFKSMGRIFVGLVKCGAWGCFDEFNRLKEDQLSAISQMIQVIQAAIKNKESACELLNRTIDVNHNAGIFVTLNPAGKGYGGRSKLPDNLKQLFRAVAMSVPDIRLIAETILLSEGFAHATPISKKIVTAFKLSKQLLSAQQHYDWGLRAIKTCLSLCGNLITKWNKANEGVEQTVEMEEGLVIQSLRVNTLSKLAFDDTRLFNGLIADIFPGIPVHEIEYEELLPAINEAIAEAKLQRIDGQVRKVLQLYEALRQRMGVVIVGPSGSGKSTLLAMLRSALEKLKIVVPLHVMNPKAMPRHQLLGNMDVDTREWMDGVLTAAARKVVKEPTDGTVQSWILCDGDVDPEWVESLNSVLDDNKLLTMPNGERIQFGSNVNFIFETHSLTYASPATVSRVGMIFLSEEDVDPQSAVDTWVTKQADSANPQLGQWLNDFFYKAVQMVLDLGHTLSVQTTRMAIVQTGLSHLVGVQSKADFTIGLIRGLGSLLYKTEREDYARNIFDLTGERSPRGNLLDCYTVDGRYVVYEFDRGLQNLALEDVKSGAMVQTVDVQRNFAILRPWLTQGTTRPFLLVGPEGCGKSSSVMAMLEGTKGVKTAVIHCSAQTEGTHIQQKLQQMCTRLSTAEGPALRPKECERLVLLLKDINLPKPDEYGTVQVHSFLQQIILYNGFYDKDLEWIRVENVQVVCTMNPSGSVGRYDLAPRFVAIISVLSMSYPDKESLTFIFTEFLQTLLQSAQLEKTSGGWSSGKGSDLAKVMVNVYEEVKRKWTVDDSSHYVFNPRDITAWILNLLRYDLENNDLAEVVYYEGQRVFADRLTKTDYRRRVAELISEQLSSTVGWRKEGGEKFFTSWLSRGLLQAIEPRDYKKHVNQTLLMHEREIKPLDIVVLPEMLGWIARADRVLSSDGGSMLLCGRSGVGRREVVSLCAYALRMQIFELKVAKNYGLREFTTELKTVLTAAGVQGQHSLLLVEDHNIVSSSFLEIINSLLAGGESPGLFTPEELEPLLAPLKEEASNEGYFGGVYNFFVTRVRKFLHIAVSMDPTNPLYEYRCQSNPSLYTKAQVLWMGTWSSSGMKRVPEMILKDIVRDLQGEKDKDKDKAEKPDDNGKVNGANGPISPRPPNVSFDLPVEALLLHNGVGEQGTPRIFRYLLDNFKRIWNEKVTACDEMRSRLINGLAKLQEAELNVDMLKKDAEEKKTKSSKKQKEADAALTEIQERMEEAKGTKTVTEDQKKTLGKEQKENAKRKAQIEQEIAHIEPVLASAREAVGSIRPEHLTEMRAMPTPPPAIKDVMEGVMRLMDYRETGGDAMKKFLGQRGVKERIINLDARDIRPEIRENVSKLMSQKPLSFKHETIVHASQAAAPLAAWVRAQIEYSTVLEKVRPLEGELNESVEKMKSSEVKVAEAEKKIKKLEDKIGELRKGFTKKNLQAASLQEAVEKAEAMLLSAAELLGKLTDENVRWTNQVTEINKDFNALPRRCLMAAGFLTYLSKSSEDIRAQTVKEWCAHLGCDFSFNRFMRRERDLLQYKSEGLPHDELSMQNAIMLLDANQTPLFIDPASQATKWLKEHLHRRPDVHSEYTTPADDRFAHILELAVRFGKTLIVAECDGIDPMLYPVMRKDLISQGPKKVVPIGDKLVDWQDTFKLYLVTRQSDLTLPPDAQSLTTEVNFSITREGLEGQLLGITINNEQPDLEQRKQANLEKEDSYKSELAGLEERLLVQLSQAEGSLLENQELVDALTKIKTSAAEISEAVTKLNEDTEHMDKERNIYRPFAKLGSKLFFIVSDLSRVNHMYQFGLPQFAKAFRQVLSASSGSAVSPQEKIKNLSENLLKEVFMLVSRGLFKGDRLLFGMHVVQGMASTPPYDSLFDQKEWNFFVNAAEYTHLGASVSGGQDIPSWVDIDSVGVFQAFKRDLPHIEQKLQPEREADTWYRWMQATTPEADMPEHMKELTAFQKLIVVQCLRPDRLTSAMDAFVRTTLTLSSLTPPEMHMSDFAKLTEPTEAILMVTTPGADPSLQVEEMAFKEVGRNNFVQIAMGGGQTDEAIVQLRSCAQRGKWLLLKNLHLVITWVSTLEKELNSLNPDPKFRLWLTTEPHARFPTVLAMSSVKLTFEAPPGIKKSLLRTYEQWTPEYLAKLSPIRCQLLFNLAWFHGLVLERRTYVPQGWSKFYEFSPADLRSAADVILAQSAEDTPDWETIYGVLENAIYGGRMDNDFDVRLLVTYLKLYFNDSKLGMGGKRAQPISKGVLVPATTNHQDFLSLVANLPENDYPATFGLPANSDRTVQREKVRVILLNLLRLREVIDVSKISKTEWADRLGPITQKWTSMCTPHASELQRKHARLDNPGPVEGFILNELHTAHDLIESVDYCMDGVDRVIRGVSLLTAELQHDSSTLLGNGVPMKWQQFECPETTDAFLKVLVTKAVALSKWHEKAQAGNVLATKLRLSDLLRPETFLNALRQQTAKQTGTALVSIVLACSWTGTIAGAGLSITVDGLQLQGAKWSDNALHECSTDDASWCKMPDCTLAWVPADPTDGSSFVLVPVYVTKSRESLLCQLRIPCPSSEVDSWILAGLALVL